MVVLRLRKSRKREKSKLISWSGCKCVYFVFVSLANRINADPFNLRRYCFFRYNSDIIPNYPVSIIPGIFGNLNLPQVDWAANFKLNFAALALFGVVLGRFVAFFRVICRWRLKIITLSARR